MSIQRGDRVTYRRKTREIPEGTVLRVLSDPEVYGGGLVVTCKWLPRGKKTEYEYALFEVEALKRAGEENEKG